MEHIIIIYIYIYIIYIYVILYVFEILDKRVADWLLMWAYWPTFAITAAYLLVAYAGPKLMKDREPFCLKWPLFFHNMALVALNIYICSEVSRIYLIAHSIV